MQGAHKAVFDGGPSDPQVIDWGIFSFVPSPHVSWRAINYGWAFLLVIFININYHLGWFLFLL